MVVLMKRHNFIANCFTIAIIGNVWKEKVPHFDVLAITVQSHLQPPFTTYSSFFPHLYYQPHTLLFIFDSLPFFFCRGIDELTLAYKNKISLVYYLWEIIASFLDVRETKRLLSSVPTIFSRPFARLLSIFRAVNWLRFFFFSLNLSDKLDCSIAEAVRYHCC